MAKKILSFEEYAAKIKGADVSEEEIDECPCGTDEEGNCRECEEGAEPLIVTVADPPPLGMVSVPETPAPF